jgi:hypothetical protein
MRIKKNMGEGGGEGVGGRIKEIENGRRRGSEEESKIKMGEREGE